MTGFTTARLSRRLTPCTMRRPPEMPRFRTARYGNLTLAITIGCLLLSAPMAVAQEVTESTLRASFILKFAKFTTWPDEVLPPKAPIKACVLGDQAFTDVLARSAKRTPLIDGHTVVVERVAPADVSARSCQLLYISGTNAKQAYTVVTSLAGAAVLTLSDIERFAQFGGAAQLYIEAGTTKFRVNLETSKKSRLQLAATLLGLAELVKNDPDAIPR